MMPFYFGRIQKIAGSKYEECSNMKRYLFVSIAVMLFTAFNGCKKPGPVYDLTISSQNRQWFKNENVTINQYSKTIHMILKFCPMILSKSLMALAEVSMN